MSNSLRILVWLCISVLASGQSQVNKSQPGSPKSPDDSTPPIKSSRIEGVVLDDRYSRPLKRGYVVVKPTGAGRALSGETDDAGKFSIENIEPGEYNIEARRDGYVGANWGRRGGIRMPRVFRLLAGQELKDLTFRLEPWNVVDGKIHFEDGEPANGVPVVLYRKQYYRGRMQYQPSGSARSNDRGEYRIAGLPPGAYIIAAIYNKPVKPRNPEDDPNEVAEIETSYATTFYTSGVSLTDAVPVKLERGLELTGLDIYLRQVRTVRVRMRITDSCIGELTSKAAVQIYRMDESDVPVVPLNADIVAAGGTYTVRGLGPGQYTIVASADAPPQCRGPVRDRKVISISERPIDGLELSLISPVTARFEISTDSPGFSRRDLGGFAFHLEARSGLPTGNISLDNDKPGVNQYSAFLDPREEYDLIVDRRPANTYLKSPLRVSGDDRIRMGTKGATLTGSVMSEKREPIAGATITLIPDPAKDRFQSYAETYSNETGTFGVNGLTPGRYIAIAWLDVAPCDFFNWDNLDACRPFGTTVDLSESDGKSLELVLKLNN